MTSSWSCTAALMLVPCGRLQKNIFHDKLLMCFPGVIALLMSDLPFYTDPVKYPNTYLSSPLLPVFLSLLIGYIVASVFFNVRVH